MNSKNQKNNKGITLIALVITIIVLLILATVCIAILMGENGILKRGKNSANETDRQTATEIMNLKITNAQIQSYAETQKMPNLQYLADRLCEDLDKDIEYVRLKEKEVATRERVTISSEEDTILTKLKEYPYEFEIDSDLKLATVDGIKVADKNTEKMEQLENEIKELKEMYQNLKNELTEPKEPDEPAGTIISYMGNSAPDGYLACNGQTYNISEYPNLAEQIKKEFGRYNYYGGNGTTTFATPNLIGKFLKGSSSAGTSEEAGLPNIEGKMNAYSWEQGVPVNAFSSQISNANIPTAGNTYSKFNYVRFFFDASKSNAIYGKSTTVTPENMSVLYCIKY